MMSLEIVGESMVDRHHTFYREIGKMVRDAREAAALTQGLLAQHVGLTRTSITNIERGRQKIQVHTLYAIAEALNVRVATLLPTEASGGIEDPRELPGDISPNERLWILRVIHGQAGEEGATDAMDGDAPAGEGGSTPRPGADD
jgi:transcriptional regulator with XRE-family HTH domain